MTPKAQNIQETALRDCQIGACFGTHEEDNPACRMCHVGRACRCRTTSPGTIIVVEEREEPDEIKVVNQDGGAQ